MKNWSGKIEKNINENIQCTGKLILSSKLILLKETQLQIQTHNKSLLHYLLWEILWIDFKCTFHYFTFIAKYELLFKKRIISDNSRWIVLSKTSLASAYNH